MPGVYGRRVPGDASTDRGERFVPPRTASPPLALAVTSAGAGVIVSVFGPWLRSGARNRSSFELIDLVERLGFAPGGVFSWAVRLWPFVPLLVVTATVATWAARHRAGGALGIATGLYVTGVAAAVRLAPNAGLVRTGWGPTAALVSGACLIVASAAALVVRSRRSPGVPFDQHVA